MSSPSVLGCAQSSGAFAPALGWTIDPPHCLSASQTLNNAGVLAGQLTGRLARFSGRRGATLTRPPPYGTLCPSFFRVPLFPFFFPLLKNTAMLFTSPQEQGRSRTEQRPPGNFWELPRQQQSAPWAVGPMTENDSALYFCSGCLWRMIEAALPLTALMGFH